MTDINDNTNIFSPIPTGYRGRLEDPDYAQKIVDADIDRIYELVEARVTEDGEWCIVNGRVGENNSGEDKMRRMMAFVSDRKHILQAVDHNLLERGGQDTVDFICRDLATAASWAIRAQDRKAGR